MKEKYVGYVINSIDYKDSDSLLSVLCEDGKSLEILGDKLLIKELSHKELSINGTIKTINFS